MEQPLRVRLFGSPELALANNARGTLATRKAWGLLAYLTRHAPSVSRSTLAALLWPELTEERGRRNLSRELTKLSALAPTSIAADYHAVGWISQGVWIDASAAEALLHTSRPQATSALAEAVTLYRGPFLDGFFLDGCAEFESWLVRERGFWQQQVARALEQLVTHHLELGEFDAAQAHARRWLELEPWQEEAHYGLMMALARAGRRTEALAQFDLCRRALACELDAAPRAATLVLAEQIRTGAFEPPELPALRVPLVPSAPPVSPQRVPNPAPAVARFFGRAAESAALARLLDIERCRIVAVLGMGGIGKTTLAAQTVRELAEGFDALVWRSLLNAPPLLELLRACLPALGASPASIPILLDDQLTLLLDCLRQQRCLLVLDNAESVLLDGERVGRYRPGYEEYGQLLRTVASYEHQSCVLLTSRELPPPLPQLAADSPLVATLRLSGLDPDAGEALLSARGLTATKEAGALVARYSGNPLALALVADAIHELYDGDLAAFLRADSVLFDDIRAVLDQQWARLTAIEQDVLLWLAVCREPCDVGDIERVLVPAAPTHRVRDALRSLQRRSLVEPGSARFGLQNVVLEYLSERLIDAVFEELVQGVWRHFTSHALMQAQALEYVRQSQQRLLLAPVTQRLEAHLTSAGLQRALHTGLTKLRMADTIVQGYAGGNALNLLLHLGVDLRDADFSRLSVWQADLRHARLPRVSFVGSDLRGSAFNEALHNSYALAWSPDGVLLASCVGAGEIRLWRTSDWQLVGSCVGPNTFVWHLAFNPTSELLASCGDDGVVRVWDVVACQPVYTLRGHRHAVQSLDWSPDGAQLITGSRDNTARIWHMERTTLLHELCGHADRVRWVAWSPNGNLVATASFDHTAVLWDACTGTRRATLAHPQEVHALAWHTNGRLLATSCFDRQVRVWDVTTCEVIRTITEPTHFAYQIAWSPDGTLIAGGGARALRIWDVASETLHAALLGHNQNVAYAVWSPNGSRLASRSETSIRVWDLASERPLIILQGTSLDVYQIGRSLDGRLFATTHIDNLIRIWDIASGSVIRTLQGPTDAIMGVSFSPDGASIAAAGLDGYLRIWDVANGLLRRALRPGRAPIDCLARSPDGSVLATGCSDGSVWFWDGEQGQALTVLRGHSLPITSITWSPDGTTLFTSSEDRTLCEWDLATEQVRAVLPTDGRSVYGIVFNPSSTTFYGTCNDETLRVWDTQTRQIVHRLPSEKIVVGIYRSPDPCRFATSGEGVVLVWDRASGKRVHRLCHHTFLGPARFVDDGRTLLTGSDDGTICFWDVSSGALLRELPTPGPYEGMRIGGATGLSAVQRDALRLLGAVDDM